MSEIPCSGNRHLREKKITFADPIAELSRGCFQNIHHKSSTRSTLSQPQRESRSSSVLECESSTRTKLPQPRKSEIFNTKVVHKVNFRSPSSKVATFQFQSSTRSALPQLQLTSRKLRMRGPVGLMSGNWRGGPSTFAKLSQILRQTFAKIRLEVALSLPRQLQNSQKLVSAGWGLLLQRRILAATLRLRILRPTLLCGHSARTAGRYTWFITPASC